MPGPVRPSRHAVFFFVPVRRVIYCHGIVPFHSRTLGSFLQCWSLFLFLSLYAVLSLRFPSSARDYNYPLTWRYHYDVRSYQVNVVSRDSRHHPRLRLELSGLGKGLTLDNKFDF